MCKRFVSTLLEILVGIIQYVEYELPRQVSTLLEILEKVAQVVGRRCGDGGFNPS